MAESGAAGRDLSDDQGSTEDSDDKFEDASSECDVLPAALDMSLHSIVVDVNASMDLFINNRFIEAKEQFGRYADRSIYHALGYATCVFIEASMTFEPADIDRAVEAARKAVQVRADATSGLSGSHAPN